MEDILHYGLVLLKSNIKSKYAKYVLVIIINDCLFNNVNTFEYSKTWNGMTHTNMFSIISGTVNLDIKS